MKKIIDRVRYDTEKATLIGSYSNGYPPNDFNFWEAGLYIGQAGRYFLYGEGGPLSHYAQPVGNGVGYGERLEPMTAGEALKWAEEYLDADIIEKHFATILTIEDA